MSRSRHNSPSSSSSDFQMEGPRADKPADSFAVERPWTLSVDDVLATLRTTRNGLPDEQANDRRQKVGENVLAAGRRLSGVRLFFRQFQNPLILALVLAGFLTLALAQWIESAVIFAAVVANALLGFWQENKAEDALEVLRSYVVVRARVRRPDVAGGEREVDARTLVPGDIIRITQGDRVPADGRVISTRSLRTDEAVLTGEAASVAKDTEADSAEATVADRASMVWSGTLVSAGVADVVVTATAGRTEFGRIAEAVAGAGREETPLQKAISTFSVRAAVVLILAGLALLGIGVATGNPLIEMVLVAVAVIVSAVPEGLPIALTVVLALGVERLARRQGIVRKLLAAETLGSTTVILTDKTGTLTEARMEYRGMDTSIGSDEPLDPETERELLSQAVLNGDVVVENAEEASEKWRVSGPPLEAALVRGAAAKGVFLPELRKQAEMIEWQLFTSEQKYSATLSRRGDRSLLVVVGAPEELASMSSLSSEKKEQLLHDVEVATSTGARVVALASASCGEYESIAQALSAEPLVFRGLIFFHDPLRAGVAEEARRIKEAGVSTVVVTGDHRGTAEYVAGEVGITADRPGVVSGGEVDGFLEHATDAELSRIGVFARVTPNQKVAIVKRYQAAGEVAAMTGDGVNDGPALRQADIGVAMGAGTDVAKSAADLVVVDNNYGTIVAAIEEGRSILGNIRKVVVYLLSDSLDELILIGGAFLAGLALPLTALQILFVKFFTDTLPAVSFTFDPGLPAEARVSRPSSITGGLFDRRMKVFLLGPGIVSSIFLFALYWFVLAEGVELDLARTFIFASFSTYILFLAFSMRSLSLNIWQYNPFGNKVLTGSVAVAFTLTLLAVYLPPLQRLLETVTLPLTWLGAVLVVGLANVAVFEVVKWGMRNKKVVG